MVWVWAGGTRITTGPLTTLEQEEGSLTLILHRLEHSLLGVYTCKARNHLGEDEGVIEVTGKPRVPSITSRVEEVRVGVGVFYKLSF